MQLEETLQLENHSEAILMGVLSPACENVYHSRQVDTNASPRISCKSVIGAQFQNQMLPIGYPPGFIYSAYECRIEAIVSTNRTEENKSGAHNATLGQARMRLSQYFVDQWQEAQLANSRAALPVLITQLKPSENDDSEADAENIDNTKLTVTCILNLNSLALY